MDWFLPNGKKLTDWQEEELQYFIDNEIPEGKHLDYKQALNLATDSDKLKFAGNVSAFANTDGGYLIFGIAEGDENLPTELCGIELLESLDETKLRIENTLRTSLQPPVQNIQIHDIELKNGKIALVLKILPSLYAPHRTKDRHFYARHSAGKYSLDVPEIRSAFLQSETLRTASQSFRLDRISQIMTHDFSTEVPSESKFVIHVIPLVSLKPNFLVDLDYLISEFGHSNFPGLGTNSLYSKYTYDGIYGKNHGNTMYSKLLDQGIFETASTYYFRRETGILPSSSLEEDIINFVMNAINFLIQKTSITLPVIISISALNIKGKKLGLPSSRFWESETPACPTNNLLLPELFINELPCTPLNFQETANLLFPLLQKWWNAFEFPKSPYFNNDKIWNG